MTVTIREDCECGLCRPARGLEPLNAPHRSLRQKRRLPNEPEPLDEEGQTAAMLAFLYNHSVSLTEKELVAAGMTFETEYMRARMMVCVYEMALVGEIGCVIERGSVSFVADKRDHKARPFVPPDPLTIEEQAAASQQP